MEIPDPIKEDIDEIGGLDEITRRIPGAPTIEKRSRIFKALADPLRLKIILLLEVQPLCACCIKELLDISDSKLSYHLSQLRDADLITGKQEKNWIIYRNTDPGRTG